MRIISVNFFHPFLADVLILYPMETPENQRLCDVSRGIQNVNIAQKWVNLGEGIGVSEKFESFPYLVKSFLTTKKQKKFNLSSSTSSWKYRHDSTNHIHIRPLHKNFQISCKITSWKKKFPVLEAYSEPCQTFKMKLFAKIFTTALAKWISKWRSHGRWKLLSATMVGRQEHFLNTKSLKWLKQQHFDLGDSLLIVSALELFDFFFFAFLFSFCYMPTMNYLNKKLHLRSLTGFWYASAGKRKGCSLKELRNCILFYSQYFVQCGLIDVCIFYLFFW